jgi:hypothetical protein
MRRTSMRSAPPAVRDGAAAFALRLLANLIIGLALGCIALLLVEYGDRHANRYARSPGAADRWTAPASPAAR